MGDPPPRVSLYIPLSPSLCPQAFPFMQSQDARTPSTTQPPSKGQHHNESKGRDESVDQRYVLSPSLLSLLSLQLTGRSNSASTGTGNNGGDGDNDDVDEEEEEEEEDDDDDDDDDAPSASTHTLPRHNDSGSGGSNLWKTTDTL